VRILRLRSDDGTNRLTRQFVLSLTDAVHSLAREDQLLVIAGNHRFFSAGADLEEIAAFDGPAALEFSLMGQALMRRIGEFPAPVCAAISGYAWEAGSTWRWLVITGLRRRTPSSDIAGLLWA